MKATKRLKSKKNPSTTNEGDQRVQNNNYNQNKSNHYIQTLSLSTTNEGDQEAQRKKKLIKKINKLERKRNLAIRIRATKNTIKRPKILHFVKRFTKNSESNILSNKINNSPGCQVGISKSSGVAGLPNIIKDRRYEITE